MKPPSQRQLRAGELIRHALTDILAREEFADPHLHGKSITITEVRISPDLKNATAFAAPLGGEDMGKTIEALNALLPPEARFHAIVCGTSSADAWMKSLNRVFQETHHVGL